MTTKIEFKCTRCYDSHRCPKCGGIEERGVAGCMACNYTGTCQTCSADWTLDDVRRLERGDRKPRRPLWLRGARR